MGVKLKIFCAAKVHCETCRSATIAGLAWRLQLLRHLDPKPEGGGGGGGNWICPEGKPFDGTPPEEKDVPAELIEDPTADNVARLAAAGRAHWKLLHTFDHVPSPEEFEAWIAGIPAFGCQCQSDFRKRLETHPFDFTSLAAFHYSGWEAHEAVNAKLGKGSVWYSLAAAGWGWPITDNAPPAA